MMRKEFVPYKEALALKELGFDEFTFGLYHYKKKELEPLNSEGINLGVHIAAPLYQQAFRWLREKHNLNPKKHIAIVNKMGFKTYKPYMNDKPLDEDDFWNGYDKYEEAELACLRKIIEIVKEKK